ncbi:TonB-dependent receptor family protein [Marinobacter shengliensis]|uniref:TonB-dependent receptor family protein n=1 Tax=Marinobacter shengliensis TaxID=1389223 RepID=UPI001E4A9EAF|nr:TonB-dependent receptor plug domain-containing protein [Marinobacter shengliensis]MCD1631072.1 TonB-dependent receptor [Marinobacter shengliensis]
MLKPIIRAMRFTVLASVPGIVMAQQTGETVYLPALDVRSLVPTSVEGMPGAASVLTRDQFDVYKPYTLHDALDFVPGVRTIDDDVLGRRSGIGVRGAPPRRSRKVLLLEDGTPINNSAYLDSGAHYTPPLERLERVEVYKGAGQIVHGPLNNHGIVNFRNLKPTPVPETVIEVGVGNQDTIQQHIHHRRTEGDVGMVFSYTGKRADGTFDVEEHQYDDFYTGLEWQVNERNQLAASVTYLRERSDGYDEANLSLQEYRDAPRNKSRFDEGREENNISVNYLKYDLTHNLQVTDDVSVSSKVFFTDLDRPRFQTRGTAPADGGVMEGRDRRYENLGLESRLEWANIEALGLTHRIQAGVRYENHNFEDRRPVGLPGEKLDEGNRGRLFAVSGEDGYTRDGRLVEYDAEAVSGYIQNSMSFGDWTVTPGLRYETYNQYKDTVFRPGSSDEGVREKDSNELFLPGISLLYTGFAQSEIYAGIHRGYAPASARSDEFPLTPETGVNSQLGIRTSAIKGVSLDAAVFHNRIKDTLIRDDVDAFGDALFVNAADSRITGVDVGARIDSSAFYLADYNLFAEAALNYTDARFTTGPLDDNRVPEIPTRAGSFTVGMDHMAGWHLSATVSHLGAFYSDIENTRELTADGEAGKVPSRTLFSARASYKLPTTTDATLWVQGRNLSDKLYISDVQDGIRPGAPRTVVAGATVKF